MRNLLVLELTNPHLRQLAVPGRPTSIQEGELIHSPTSEYPNTRTWARFLHESLPTLDGLAWRPRLAGTGWSYVFFGDRFVAGDLKAEPTPTNVDSGSEIRRDRANCQVGQYPNHRIRISRMSQNKRWQVKAHDRDPNAGFLPIRATCAAFGLPLDNQNRTSPKHPYLLYPRDL